MGDLLAQIVARRAALEHQHFELRRETLRLAPPVMQHRGRADHQRRLRILPVLILEPRQPRQRLQGLAQAHVVREDSAQPKPGQMAEEIKTLLLIRAHLRPDRGGQGYRRQALEVLEPLPQCPGLGGVAETLQALLIPMRRLLQADALGHRYQPVHAQVGYRLVR